MVDPDDSSFLSLIVGSLKWVGFLEFSWCRGFFVSVVFEGVKGK